MHESSFEVLISLSFLLLKQMLVVFKFDLEVLIVFVASKGYLLAFLFGLIAKFNNFLLLIKQTLYPVTHLLKFLRIFL